MTIQGRFDCFERSAAQVNTRIGSYPSVRVQGDGGAVFSQAGGVLLVETIRKTGLGHCDIGGVDALAQASGAAGSGEPVAGLLRPGNAGSDTAADHITTTRMALAQLPKQYRCGRQTLIRTDSAGGPRVPRGSPGAAGGSPTRSG